MNLSHYKPYLKNWESFYAVETRRGRKLRVGDTIEVIGEKEVITLTQPSPEEIEDYQADKLEKERVAQLVKKLNKEQKQKKDSKPKKEENKRKPVRFPGT